MRRPLPWLLALGLLVNLGLLTCSYVPAMRPLQGDERYYMTLATRIAEGRPAALSPLTPPLYGELLGRVVTAFGPRRLPMQALQIAMWLIAGVLLSRSASRLGPDQLAAHATAAFFLLSPDLMAFSHFFWPEIVHLFFMVAAWWLLVCHGRRLAGVVAAGVLTGCALLTKLVLYPIAWTIPVAFACCAELPRRARLVRAALLAAVITLTIAPTMLWNLGRHGELMIADSAMLNLWLGLNPGPGHPQAMRQFMEAGPDMPTRNAVYREKIARYLRQHGLGVTLRRQLSRQHFHLLHYESWFTRRLSRSPLLRSTKGQYQLRSPRIVAGLHLYAHAVHAMLLAAMAFGIVALRPRRAGWWNVVVGFLLYNLGVFVVGNVNPRYFVQMMPAVMLLAGVGVSWLWAVVRGGSPASSGAFAFTRARLACGLVLAVLIELVAFRDLPVVGL